MGKLGGSDHRIHNINQRQRFRCAAIDTGELQAVSSADTGFCRKLLLFRLAGFVQFCAKKYRAVYAKHSNGKPRQLFQRGHFTHMERRIGRHEQHQRLPNRQPDFHQRLFMERMDGAGDINPLLRQRKLHADRLPDAGDIYPIRHLDD